MKQIEKSIIDVEFLWIIDFICFGGESVVVVFWVESFAFLRL